MTKKKTTPTRKGKTPGQVKANPPKGKTNPATGKHPGGRPTKYDPAVHPEKGYKCSLAGMTVPELALALDVSETAFHVWMNKHVEFRDAITRGRVIADAHIASRLFQRAEGYKRITQQAFKIKVGRDMEKVEVVDLITEEPPETNAIKYWLNNRMRGKWREKQVVELEGDDKLVAALLAGRARLNAMEE